MRCAAGLRHEPWPVADGVRETSNQRAPGLRAPSGGRAQEAAEVDVVHLPIVPTPRLEARSAVTTGPKCKIALETAGEMTPVGAGDIIGGSPT